MSAPTMRLMKTKLLRFLVSPRQPLSRTFILTTPKEGRGQTKPSNVLKKSEKFLERKFSGKKHKREHWYATPLGLTGGASFDQVKRGPSKGLQRRAEQLSVVMTHYVTSLIYNGEIDGRLVDKNIEISKVKMSKDVSALHVYWMGVGSGEDDEVQEILKEASYKLRSVLSGLHLIGSVPPVVFIKDMSKARIDEVQRLLERADMGPDFEPSELGEDLKSDTLLPIPQHTTLQDRLDVASKRLAERDLESCLDQVEYIRPESSAELEERDRGQPSDIDVTLRSDVYGLDHASLTKQILDNKRKIKNRPVEVEVGEMAVDGITKRFSKDELRKLMSKRLPKSGSKSHEHLSSQFHKMDMKDDEQYEDDYCDDSDYEYEDTKE